MTARADIRAVAPAVPDPLDMFADQVRDTLALRNRRMEELHPEALDLEARILVAMHAELHGCTSALADVEAPEHLREVFRGARCAHLGRHVCRLVVSARPEAGRAVDAALAILASARGYRLEPSASPEASLGEAMARLTTETADVAAAGHRALEDGQLKPAELDSIERQLNESDHASATVRAALAAARRHRR